jgi:DNA invertase Pin-like site-specific DNA recombinase
VTPPPALPAKRTRVSAKAKRTALAADKAVIVLRVSTTRQGESGLGLTAQEEHARDFCSAEGLEVVAVLSDVASGKVAPSERAGMAEALRLLAAQEAAVLVSARADRLTRVNADLYSLMDISAKQGWCIRTADKIVDTCTESGRMMAAVAGLFAQQERALISARTKAAKQVQKAQGVRLGGKIISTPEPTRQRLRALRAEGCTMQVTAERLNTEGMLTATGKLWTWQNVQRVEASLRLDDEANERRASSAVNG